MKNKVNNSSNTNGEVPKQKERHIVSWSQEEDDILREQIRIHGADNWAIIASKFNDKTTRQCRRRWFTYLNSDFKKGGWSPEEDMLLCEAQRIFGNRWTEIAKVVSGRTDNAVKNRFTTLCKKRAKENSTTSYINLNNKRVIFRNGFNADGGFESVKKMRSYIVENCNQGERLAAENNETRRTFLKKDDPKVLAVKVNSEKTDPSLETAWMMIEDFLKQNEENEYTYESSPASSEYSTGSTLMCNALVDKTEECEAEFGVLNQETCRFELQKNQLDNQDCVGNGIIKVKNVLTCDEMEGNSGAICEYSNTEFGSPLHVTPLFGALAAAIPSPEFSESEKHFLMKTLGMESTSPTRITNPSQSPPCKRSLLHCL